MLAACRRAAETAGVSFPELVYPYIEQEVNRATPLSVQRLCELTEVSRAGFYRWKDRPAPTDSDLDLRDEIQRIALAMPAYGWRRIHAELSRRAWIINHKRIRRIMQEDNLLCVRRRKFVVTTDSNHGQSVYPNLAAGLVTSGLNQLWVAHITCIRLEVEFVYLAVVLDAHSRRVIGWSLSRTLEDELTLAALHMALERRSPPAGLIHHSDRGSQYASGEYTDLLKASGVSISMSRKGNPWDNAACESFMKTLKAEEVYRQEYSDLAKRSLRSAISLRRSTMSGGCIQRSATARPSSLKRPCASAPKLRG